VLFFWLEDEFCVLTLAIRCLSTGLSNVDVFNGCDLGMKLGLDVDVLNVSTCVPELSSINC